MLVATCIALLTSCFGAISNWLDSIGMGVGIAVRTLMMGFVVLRILIRYLIAPATGGGSSDTGRRASRDAHKATNRGLRK